MMRNSVLWVISILLIFSWGCNQKSKTKKKTAIETTSKKIVAVKQKKAIPQKALKPKFTRLTNSNIDKELLKYGKENPETLILLKTPLGDMKIKLFKNTPLHRANMIRLIKNNFYQHTLFYRVVDEFMIQGGDNDDWERKGIKNKMGLYSIPAELRKENIHRKGALSMARDYEDNPDLRSVSFDFFIVQGTPYTPAQIKGAESEYGLVIAPEHKTIYENIGGTPHLDGKHTVFGQVIEGLEVIDAIAAVKVDKGDWPIEDVTIEFKILK